MKSKQEQHKQIDALINFYLSHFYNFTNINKIKQYKFCTIILSTSISALLCTYKLLCFINRDFALGLTLKLMEWIIFTIRHCYVLLCKMKYIKPFSIAKNIRFTSIIKKHNMSNNYESNIDTKQIGIWKNTIKEDIVNTDDGRSKLAFANNLINYEKHKNRKIQDVLFLWNAVHNKSLIPYIFNNVLKIESTDDIKQIFEHLESFDSSIITKTQTMILLHDVNLLNDTINGIIEKQNSLYTKLVFGRNANKIVSKYSHIRNTQFIATSKQLKSANQLAFSVGREYLIDFDSSIIKKYTSIVLLSIIISQIVYMYINYVEIIKIKKSNTVYNKYIQTSIKFVEFLLIDDVISPLYIHNLNKNRNENSRELYYNSLNDDLKTQIELLRTKTNSIQTDINLISNIIWTIFDFITKSDKQDKPNKFDINKDTPSKIVKI